MTSQAHHKGVAIEDVTVFRKGKGYTIKPKALDIIWGGDTRYWSLPKSEDGQAELLQVSWLEVSGSLELSRFDTGTYNISFIVSMQPDAFGWRGTPVYLMAKVGSGRFIWKSTDLSSRPVQSHFKIPDDIRFTVTSKDRASGEKLRFGLYEIWKGRWKGGLVIHEVEITPSNTA